MPELVHFAPQLTKMIRKPLVTASNCLGHSSIGRAMAGLSGRGFGWGLFRLTVCVIRHGAARSRFTFTLFPRFRAWTENLILRNSGTFSKFYFDHASFSVEWSDPSHRPELGPTSRPCSILGLGADFLGQNQCRP